MENTEGSAVRFEGGSTVELTQTAALEKNSTLAVPLVFEKNNRAEKGTGTKAEKGSGCRVSGMGLS